MAECEMSQEDSRHHTMRWTVLRGLLVSLIKEKSEVSLVTRDGGQRQGEIKKMVSECSLAKANKQRPTLLHMS